MSCGPQMPAMPLSMVKAGETVRVSRVKGNEDMKHHLKDLGFVEGSEVHVVSSSGANIIVTVLGARFGICIQNGIFYKDDACGIGKRCDRDGVDVAHDGKPRVVRFGSAHDPA